MNLLMAPGAMILRDLLAEAKEEGCRIRQRRRVRFAANGVPRIPRYLERDGFEAPIPYLQDDSIVAPEVVANIWRRLGLDHKVTW